MLMMAVRQDYTLDYTLWHCLDGTGLLVYINAGCVTTRLNLVELS